MGLIQSCRVDLKVLLQPRCLGETKYDQVTQQSLNSYLTVSRQSVDIKQKDRLGNVLAGSGTSPYPEVYRHVHGTLAMIKNISTMPKSYRVFQLEYFKLYFG
ncbi:uncharacterized protein T551_01134 [Pneumocystis jirovecii RU7]|uniref:Uncharacterized protein n=1 Tax=Pneumocystis jirovecii (strain RU7) TaxID=1408657 RepID=A0A0W4ZU10_PNEJ7|nr:uncharacterized protein T551_01134 [Pneumocystis jirovecii RU7]KTW31873.1 hypothetical protein T551_01134 [Pneumocystis jirovecii RU7]